MSRKLYVGNFPYETGEVELQTLFGRAGHSSDAEAQQAISELNDHQLGGRGLKVNEARPEPLVGGAPRRGPRGRSEPRW